jgi:hypothetical protein
MASRESARPFGVRGCWGRCWGWGCGIGPRKARELGIGDDDDRRREGWDCGSLGQELGYVMVARYRIPAAAAGKTQKMSGIAPAKERGIAPVKACGKIYNDDGP